MGNFWSKSKKYESEEPQTSEEMRVEDECWRDVRIKIAVTGESGVGKSSFIIITLAGIVTYFAGYNEQISGLKYILARRIWNCLLPPAIVLS